MKNPNTPKTIALEPRNVGTLRSAEDVRTFMVEIDHLERERVRAEGEGALRRQLRNFRLDARGFGR